jgi:cytochrome P450
MTTSTQRTAPDSVPLINDAAFKAETHDRYATLRARGKIQRVRQPSGLDLYLVLDYRLARVALTHPDLLKDPETGRKALDAAGVLAYQGRGQGFGSHMLMSDPPDHARLRGPVARAFTPQRAEALRPRIRQLADELIDAIQAKAAAGEAIDLVEHFTAPLPVMVICELLGVPPGARHDLRRWTLAALAGGAATPSPAQRQGRLALNAYFSELIAAKQAATDHGDDLLSELIRLYREDGNALNDEELLGTAVILLIAGHETTVNLLGNAIAALLDHPRQAQLLRARPELLPGAVEEFLRFDAPVDQTPLRFAARDLELDGVLIPQGSALSVSLAAVGRDPATSSGEGTLDVTRKDGRHLSFGHGIHYCVGAPLARIESTVALDTLLRRLPGLRLVGTYQDLTWTQSGMMHGPLKLPVRI